MSDTHADPEVIAAARSGDPAALARIEETRFAALFDLVVRATLDDYVAETIVRDVFARLRMHVAEWSPYERVEVHLARLAIRQLVYCEPLDVELAADLPRYFTLPEEFDVTAEPVADLDASGAHDLHDDVDLVHALEDTAPFTPPLFDESPEPAPEAAAAPVDRAARDAWLAFRRMGGAYKTVALHLRYGLSIAELTRALGLEDPDDVRSRIEWAVRSIDESLPPRAADGLTASQLFARFVPLLPGSDDPAAPAWVPAKVPARGTRRPLVLAGVATLGAMTLLGGFRAFANDTPTKVLATTETRVPVTTTAAGAAPGRGASSPTTAAGAAPVASASAATTPGAPETTGSAATGASSTTRPRSSTTQTPGGPADPGPTAPSGPGSSTTTPASTVPGAPGTTAPSTTAPSTTAPSTTRPTTTTPGTTAPPTTAPPTTAPPTTAPPTTAPPTTAPPTTTTAPPTTTTAPPTTTTAPPTTTTAPPTTTTTEPPPATTTPPADPPATDTLVP